MSTLKLTPSKIDHVLEMMVNSNVTAEGALSALEEDEGDEDEEEEKEGTKTPSEDDVIDFLIDNPDPDDDDVHEWTEDEGFNTPKAEAIFYSLATRFVDFLTGGKSNEPNAPEKFDPKQIAMGIKVEAEHIDDELSQEKIASDHCAEAPLYYSYLDLAEELMKLGKKSGDEKVLAQFKAFVEGLKK